MPEENVRETCGIVMPISSIEGCDESHWAEVLEILSDAIDDAGFEPNLVSNADDVGIIHKRIIQNLYENPLVVCDVSCKNPNVMFELGLRLAFDKPTIIVKDSKTSYTFDTSAIEHLEYPRDLRFSSVVDFKSNLSDKLKATLIKSKDDPNFTTFLKHFGTFHTAKIESTEVSGDQLILEELQDIRKSISVMKARERRVHFMEQERNHELVIKLIKGMKDYCSSQGLRGKVHIRKHKDEIADHMVMVIDAQKYFPHKREFDRFFSDVFETIYG